MLIDNLQTRLPTDGTSTLIGRMKIMRLHKTEAVELVNSALLLNCKRDIAICNAHTSLIAFDDVEYAAVLDQMTLLNDGVGINLASLILSGKSFPDNLNGTDLIPYILQKIETPLRIYLLGAKDDVVERAKTHIELTYPKHQVVGLRNGYFSTEDCAKVCADISETKPDLLLVAMGNPRQERFIVDNRSNLDVGVTIGVGALFDFMSGSVARAPKFVQMVGLEWLFRLAQEPKRLFHRYAVGIPRFLVIVLKWKFKKRVDRA